MCRMIGLAVLAVTMLSFSAARAEEETALSRMQAVATEYFQAHNSGDAEQVRAFEVSYRAESALKKRSRDERVERWRAMHAQLGAITPGDMVRSTDSTVVYLAEAKKLGMWLECAFKFETEPPYKLIELMIRPTSPPAQATPALAEWNTIQELLTQLVEQSGLPAIAAAVIEGDQIVDAAAVGTRSAGGSDSVTVDDYWHIGSITKSVTATMIGRLVELGVLDWNLTVGEALSGIEMRPEYRDVTLDDLLHHRGGIQAYTFLDAADEARLSKLTGTPTEIRAGFAAEVLQREPANPRGQFSYSNAGYALAALMAERAAGTPWRDLLRVYVFEPAGLEESTFGWPATAERPDQPRGHYFENDKYRPQGLDEYVLGEYIAPAGDVSMSINDLARYARMHLAGLRGQDGAVTAATFKLLHTDPPDRDSDTRYAAGWVIGASKENGETHWHNGSAGTFYAQVVLYPERNRAVVVAMNVGFERGQALADRIAGLLAAK